jgi:hypothetical protein
MWRFVNRAIDEVENGACPGVLLLCRNSTDTAYWGRLKPYPRIFLRRNAITFKDYPDHSPIGFGIALVCIVDAERADASDTFKRFHELFADLGEMDTPVDEEHVGSGAFMSLLMRLQVWILTLTLTRCWGDDCGIVSRSREPCVGLQFLKSCVCDACVVCRLKHATHATFGFSALCAISGESCQMWIHCLPPSPTSRGAAPMSWRAAT